MRRKEKEITTHLVDVQQIQNLLAKLSAKISAGKKIWVNKEPDGSIIFMLGRGTVRISANQLLEGGVL